MTRATSPVVGTTLVVGVTVVLAAMVGTAFLAVPPPQSPPVAVSLSLSATTDGSQIALVHEGGPSLDVRDLTVRIEIDGTPLVHQPPVPFFSAIGFRPGPTGPFNTAADPTWEAGETATLRLAGTNAPPLERGATLSVSLYRDGTPVASLETTVE